MTIPPQEADVGPAHLLCVVTDGLAPAAMAELVHLVEIAYQRGLTEGFQTATAGLVRDRDRRIAYNELFAEYTGRCSARPHHHDDGLQIALTRPAEVLAEAEAVDPTESKR